MYSGKVSTFRITESWSVLLVRSVISVMSLFARAAPLGAPCFLANTLTRTMSILNGDSEHHSQRALAKGKGRAADQSPDGLPAAKKAKPNQASLFARLPKWPAGEPLPPLLEQGAVAEGDAGL